MSNLIRLAAILAGLAACGGGPPAVPDAAAELRIEPARVDFGVLVFGAAPVARRIEVTNLAAARALDLTARIEGAGAASFAIAAADCGALDPGRSCHLDVTATAAADGPLEAAVIVASGARRGAAALVGAGRVDGRVTVAQVDPHFGRIAIGLAATQAPRLAFTVINTGAGALPPPTVAIAGSEAFHLLSTTCGGRALGAGERCAFTIDFRPAQVGMHEAALTVTAGAQSWQGTVDGRGHATLTVTGVGDGTVDGPGWSCGMTCRVLPDTSPVAIAATAAPGAVFAGWGGAAAACGTTPTCAVAIDAAEVTVDATFTAAAAR